MIIKTGGESPQWVKVKESEVKGAQSASVDGQKLNVTNDKDYFDTKSSNQLLLKTLTFPKTADAAAVTKAVITELKENAKGRDIVVVNLDGAEANSLAFVYADEFELPNGGDIKEGARITIKTKDANGQPKELSGKILASQDSNEDGFWNSISGFFSSLGDTVSQVLFGLFAPLSPGGARAAYGMASMRQRAAGMYISTPKPEIHITKTDAMDSKMLGGLKPPQK
ncbi:hypothetical protein KAI87_14050 [Myxococcota bacterium]|nr:hypothetical protein [Myxococcota bacterium]